MVLLQQACLRRASRQAVADVGSKEGDMLEMLEVVSPDTAVAAAPYQTTFSHAVDDIFRSLVIRGAASMLADDDSDMTFCVKLNSDSLARAVQYRGPAGGGSRLQLVDLQRLTVCAVDQERCRGYCFTTKANVQAVRLGHCPVASLGVQQSRKTFTVESSPVQLPSVAEPGQQDCTNVVLRLDSLPLQALLKICTWTVRPDLVYSLRGFSADGLSGDEMGCLPALLADLLASGGMDLKGTDKEYSRQRSVLCAGLGAQCR